MYKIIEINMDVFSIWRENAGVISGIIAFCALAVSIVALLVTVLINRKQVKLLLYDKRYAVYDRFFELVKLVELLTNCSFTYKGKMMIWNGIFFGKGSDSFRIGSKIIQYDDELSELQIGSDKYQAILALREEKITEKFAQDYSTFLSDEKILSRSRFLFPDEITVYVAKFVEIYSEAIFAANYADEIEMEKIFNAWRTINEKIKEKKIVDKMEKYMLFLK